MKKQINLLPWRLKQHRQQSRALLRKLIALCLGVFILSMVLNNQTQQLSMQLTTQQTALQQTNTQLTQLERQIVQSRQNYIPAENSVPIDRMQVEKLWDSLSRLPLQQGELIRLSLNHERLELTGTAGNQEEFERLNRFLTEYPLFKRATLSQFIPQTDNSLQFQFTLDLEEPK